MPQKPLYSRYDAVIMGDRGRIPDSMCCACGMEAGVRPSAPHYDGIGPCCQVDCGINADLPRNVDMP